MITIFNRKELIITMEMKRQADVRDILSQNGIDYIVKITNLDRATKFGGPRARTGSYGVNRDFCYEYKIFVHRDDFEKAKYLIQKLNNN